MINKKPKIKLGELADESPQEFKFYMILVMKLWEKIKKNRNIKLDIPENEQQILLMNMIDDGYIIVVMEGEGKDALFYLDITEEGIKKLEQLEKND